MPSGDASDASEVLSQVQINTAGDAASSSSNAPPCKSASGLSSPSCSQSIDLAAKAGKGDYLESQQPVVTLETTIIDAPHFREDQSHQTLI